jgi:hypothetical protein
LNTSVFFLDKFYAGAGYKVGQSISMNLGWDIKLPQHDQRIRLAYAWQYSLSSLSSSYFKVHEFTLGYTMPHKLAGPISRPHVNFN